MTEITKREFVRLAALCIAAGLLIGGGWAWIMSVQIPTITYMAPQTVQGGTSNSEALHPLAVIVPGHLTTTQGLIVLFILIVVGSILGISARKIQEWNVRRLERAGK